MVLFMLRTVRSLTQTVSAARARVLKRAGTTAKVEKRILSEGLCCLFWVGDY